MTVCNKDNKPVCNKANKLVCKRGLTHHQIYQAHKQQNLNQSLLHNTGSKSNQRQLLVCTSVYSANTKLSDTSDLKNEQIARARAKTTISLYIVPLSFSLSFFLYFCSITVQQENI
jgi:hypothetical protein